MYSTLVQLGMLIKILAAGILCVFLVLILAVAILMAVTIIFTGTRGAAETIKESRDEDDRTGTD